ncbi:MAG TPA: type II toxin-antitoxin system RelE/ParE family toxin [Terricaulis sp.]|nr:type II toxin-antitoxin system RelE/ParE family toxin [Terricaulis sp.]
MSYRVARLSQANDDLDALFDFLLESYLHFDDDLEAAVERASQRVARIKADLRALGKTPHQGTLLPHLMPGLRNVTKDRAIFYFTVDDDAQLVRVLAVFFGGQEHQRAMLKRLASGR